MEQKKKIWVAFAVTVTDLVIGLVLLLNGFTISGLAVQLLGTLTMMYGALLIDEENKKEK